MKTSELTGAALDWAVAKCVGMHVLMARGGRFVFDSDAFPEYRNDYNDDKMQAFKPSTNWAQGGPIIEREKLNTKPSINGDYWVALDGNPSRPYPTVMFIGPTPLIAAMRCYVASKLGDDIEVPPELK